MKAKQPNAKPQALAKRRRNEFEKPNDKEIAKMEHAFQTVFELPQAPSS
jgi:hypothetical protein